MGSCLTPKRRILLLVFILTTISKSILLNVVNCHRTVGFYNIQDNAVLETTSNPLWAAAIYYRLREVERDAANHPDDGKSQRGIEQSFIQKYMALGILFNGGKK